MKRPESICLAVRGATPTEVHNEALKAAAAYFGDDVVEDGLRIEYIGGGRVDQETEYRTAGQQLRVSRSYAFDVVIEQKERASAAQKSIV